MKVVIDIDDEIYKHIISMQFYIPYLRNGKSLLGQIIKAIRTGTPLPKGHGDLIDSSNLLCINEYDGENERTYVPYYEIENAKPIIKADKEWIKKMEEDRLVEFLNKLNDLASEYGLIVGGHYQEEEQLQLLMIKTIETPKKRKGTPREDYEPLYDCEN